MTLVEQINDGIKNAMKNRDQLRLDTLRMLKSKILTVDARGNLSDTDVLKLFKTYAGSLEEALEIAQTAKREDTALKLKGELEIVREFLPKAPSLEETKQIVQKAIEASGATSKKEFGLVMKKIMEINPAVEGKLAKDLANELLNS